MKAEGRITDVPGIGKKSAAELSSLGIRTLRDMVLFPPRSYDDRREERNLSDTTPDNPSIACRITVISHSQFPSKRSGMTLKATCMDDDDRRLELLCFNRPFMKDMLKLGSSWYITASAVERNRNGIYSTASFELKRTKEEAGIGRILPVYPLTGSITEKMLRNASAYAIDALSPFADELPYDLYGKLTARQGNNSEISGKGVGSRKKAHLIPSLQANCGSACRGIGNQGGSRFRPAYEQASSGGCRIG